MALPLDFTGRTIVVVGCHKGGMGGATAATIRPSTSGTRALSSRPSTMPRNASGFAGNHLPAPRASSML